MAPSPVCIGNCLGREKKGGKREAAEKEKAADLSKFSYLGKTKGGTIILARGEWGVRGREGEIQWKPGERESGLV